MILIAAPGTAAPVESVTSPVIVPVATWALNCPNAKATRQRILHTHMVFLLRNPGGRVIVSGNSIAGRRYSSTERKARTYAGLLQSRRALGLAGRPRRCTRESLGRTPTQGRRTLVFGRHE